MKRIKSIILVVLMMVGSLQSCEETLDINTNPLAASSADPNAVLPFVFVQYSARKVSELGTRICDVSQYISNTFNSPNRGDVSSFLTGNTWTTYYVNVLGNLSLVKADAAAAGVTNNNVNAIATVLMAQVFYELTSLFEEIPFTEALNGQDFPNPNFDDQQTVLSGIVAMYDEAIALIDTMPTTGNFVITPTSDMYYGGDIASWRMLANSLKLRTLMMLKNGGQNVDVQINEALAQPLMENNNQTAMLQYSGQPGAQSAMLTIITAFFGSDNESQNIFGPGDPIDQLLNGSGDPRWDLWVARNDLPTPGNDLFPDQTTSVLSNNIIRFTLPDVLMMPSEIDLYKAQLALEGFIAAGDADINYRNGVRNAIEWWAMDIPGQIGPSPSLGDIDAYVNGLATPTLNDVFEQQYLSAFLQPVMAWNIWRINKVPALDPPPNSTIGTVLRRFVYPPNEIAANPNVPADKPTQEPMWFEN